METQDYLIDDQGLLQGPLSRGMDQKVAETTAAVMVTASIIFTITGGPIRIEDLISVCTAANGATASTLQYQSVPSSGATATTFSGASASLANAAIGATVRLNGTALTTAPDLVAAAAGGVVLGANVSNRIIVHQGTIKIVIGVGSTTGTWKHHLRYTPLSANVSVS